MSRWMDTWLPSMMVSFASFPVSTLNASISEKFGGISIKAQAQFLFTAYFASSAEEYGTWKEEMIIFKSIEIMDVVLGKKKLCG